MGDMHGAASMFVPFLSSFSRPRSWAAAGLVALGSLAGALAQTPFVPDDPYFAPASGTPGSDQPSAGYYGQWYLVNQMPLSAVNAGLDVNIAGAWARGLTGAGVIIAIADQNGVEGDHPDLAANFLNQYSYTFNLTPEQNGAPGFLRGAPTKTGDNHGTAVAGVAVAVGGNGIGLTGAAPGASLASLNNSTTALPPGITSFQARAAAILFQGQTDVQGNPNPYVAYTPTPGTPPPIRIMNHSYGTASGYASDGAEVQAALHASAEMGVIHVFAAGNQRYEGPNPRSTADANKSQNQASPDVITVAALGSDGKYSGRSSFGANIFVTAPSDSLAGSGLYAMPTTDRVGTAGYSTDFAAGDPYFNFSNPGPNDGANYFSRFGGTSASAPLVAGILALGVEANSAMDMRMAKHLLARTSRVIDPTDTQTATSTGGWVTNSAGYHFNNNYGFGLIDADAFTLAATQYSGVTELVTHTTGDIGVGLSFAEGIDTITRIANVAAPGAMPLEYVQVRFLLTGLESDWDYYVGFEGEPATGAIAGDFEAWLTSPDGTRNRLFLDDTGIPTELADARRNHGSDTLDWTFTSYAYWGEELDGDWIIELINHSQNTTNLGTWDNYSMTFGTGDITGVPEPGTITLVLLGLGAVLYFRRRKVAA